MSDPISVFPLFVRNQKFPPTVIPSGRTVVQDLQVSVVEDPISVTVNDEAVFVTVSPRNITVEV